MKKALLIIPFLVLVMLIFALLTLENKKNIIGKWKSLDENNEYYYIFNNDKTCSYEMKFAKLGCTYENDDKIITILFKGTEQAKTYDYYFEGQTLVIKDDIGKDNKFIKNEQ